MGLSDSDSPEAVMRTYEKSLRAAGWEASESVLMGPWAVTEVEKGLRAVSVTAMSIDVQN